MPRYFLELAFNGFHYHGWQMQHNATGVQEVINKALSTLAGNEVTTLGCCRTDSGVHAQQFFLHTDWNKTIEDKSRFLFSLNGILPDDIVVYQIYEVPDKAHARFDANRRTYRYFAFRNKNPFLKNAAAPFFFDLDKKAIDECCKRLLKYSDFSTFAKTGGDENPVCEIYEASWEMKDNLHCFTITANRFLRGMVRAVTGTLVNAGKGLISADEFEEIIRSGNRHLAGVSVPAHGLYLTAVAYPFLKVHRPVYFPFVINA
jgi:tRNA pseudouridine38-40 synthase